MSKQLYDILKNRKREKTMVQEALDKQPQIKQQMELGNIEVVTRLLNEQILRQANQLDRAYDRIDHLEHRENALEAEVEGYQKVITQCNAKMDKFTLFIESLGYDPETLHRKEVP